MNTEIFEQELIHMKNDLLARLIDLEDGLKEQKQGQFADINELAQSIQDDEVTQRLDDLERSELKKIDSALGRIKDGTYGICAECGGSISKKRLKAIPFATICINCAEQ